MTDTGADEATASAPSPLSVIVSLPNNASDLFTRHCHESDAKNDWRFWQFVLHHHLGVKVAGTPWHMPMFCKRLALKDVLWLRDDRIGVNVVFPAAGFMTMVTESLFQCRQSVQSAEVPDVNPLRYRFRNCNFDKMLVLEEPMQTQLMLTP